MAKPNYSFEKRQRDLAKKKKKEEKEAEKRLRKAGTGEPGAAEPEGAPDSAPQPIDGETA
ncbi:MAG: hypothetical protein CVU59_02420 [Deltaproteobacteria bacterium HGW-Deltaproteobacteria-17]|nr:MAG: hypothetical protein CVU59_02420 [Deltaproteobacteria bacterium HGW-Deltaproteobacteria-17]PKO84442.1 MAG: hypothetical protein CVU17_02245 [Betaproteobacteria bacterium HGW-Betaproteobacteria-11]